MWRGGFVYIMTNRPNGIIYVGVTNDIARRAWEHREGLVDGLTKRYGLKRLVYYERFESIVAAIQAREEHQALFARLEGAVDPGDEPRMGRPLRDALRTKSWMAGTSPALTKGSVPPVLRSADPRVANARQWLTSR